MTPIGEAFKTVIAAFEALTLKNGGERSLKEEVLVSSFKKFFNGQAKAGGDVLEAESDEEEVDLPDLVTVDSPVSSASSSKTNSSSIYYGAAPPMASEYNEMGMPRISYRDISPERQGVGGCLKRGVPTYKPKVVGRL